MIEERIKQAIKHREMNYHDVESKTGFPESRWNKALNGHLKLRWEEVESITKLFPEFSYWITTGKTLPESGQISPEIEATAESYQKQGKG